MKTLLLQEKIPYDAAKWQKMQVLLDKEEFQALLNFAGGVLFDRTQKADALEAYGEYADSLKGGKIPEPPSFAWMWSLTEEALYILDTGTAKQILPLEPVVQITHHQMNYTPEENVFRSNLFGPETIYWGLQFAFPQLYMEPDTKEVVKVLDAERFVNVKLYQMIKSFLRENSVPTPFKGHNAPQRVGKKALEWVNNHPHLKKKGLLVLR